jgi:hypothetical protein
MQRRTGVFWAATFLAVFTAQVLGNSIVQNFNTDNPGDSPADWLDTDQNNLSNYPPAVDYFRVADVGGEKALGVISGLIDIHSHYVPSGSSTWTIVRFEGRMRADHTNAGVGVTFLSNYPTSDTYYSLVSAPYTGKEFVIDSHGTAVQGDTGSGVVRTNAAWTRYRIEITNTGTQTEIRAKVWLDGGSEPASWQIDCYDNSGTRRTTGTVGAWSMWSSSLCYWDDFTVLVDECLSDPNKTEPGICGCGYSDVDTDSDGFADCVDECPEDPNKTLEGECGCGAPDVDTDTDGVLDCNDACPEDPNKVLYGLCGCGVPEGTCNPNIDTCGFTPTPYLVGGLPAAPALSTWNSLTTVGLADEFDDIPPLANTGKVFYVPAFSNQTLQWSPEVISETVRVLGSSFVDAHYASSTHIINGRRIIDWIIDYTTNGAELAGMDTVPTLLRISIPEGWLSPASFWLEQELSDMNEMAQLLKPTSMCVTLVVLDQEHTVYPNLSSKDQAIYRSKVERLIAEARALWPNAVVTAYGNGHVGWSWGGWVWRDLYPPDVSVDAGSCDLYHEDAANLVNRMIYMNSLDACRARGIEQMVPYFYMNGAYRAKYRQQSQFVMYERDADAIANQAWESIFLHGRKMEFVNPWPAWGRATHWILLAPAGGTAAGECVGAECPALHAQRVHDYADLLRNFAKGAYGLCRSNADCTASQTCNSSGQCVP